MRSLSPATRRLILRLDSYCLIHEPDTPITSSFTPTVTEHFVRQRGEVVAVTESEPARLSPAARYVAYSGAGLFSQHGS